jgi:aldehyde:ferredoxin oxidoreductase
VLKSAPAKDPLEGGNADHPSRRSARILRIDLGRLSEPARAGALAPAPERFEPEDPLLQAVGSWTGSALATSLLLDARRRGQRPLPFVVAVGSAVRRGLPTAARATVAARSPLSGLYSEGQVGGELGRRLAGLVDAVVLEGHTRLPGAVLLLGPEGQVELLSIPDLADSEVRATGSFLNARFGDSGALLVGPAGEHGVAFASLANAEDPPSFVGRGGLGAVFGALGLKALVVKAPLPPDPHQAEELKHSLTQSPRLRMRAEGGTLELVHSFAARGDLRARNFDQPLERREAARFSAAAQSLTHERKGCRGCPTPCGPVFRDAKGDRQGARFGTLYALGPNLGLPKLEIGLELLSACDAVGLDAKEMGACLALFALARERGLIDGPPLWGRPAALLDLVAETARGVGEGELLGLGAMRLASELGLALEARVAKGQAARPEANLAAVLGQCVSSRGADPIKSFPFLSGDASDRERLEDLLAPLPLPPGAEDLRRPEGKGRIVWWHENLALALDSTGFCAFSAGALLADGILGLDELGEWLLEPELLEELGGEGGAALQALGATLALLQRELNQELGSAPDADRPEWARRQLELEGMWPEYRLLRGLDEEGRTSERARALLGTPELVQVGFPDLEEPFVLWPRAGGRKLPSQEPGHCTVRSFGPLARAFGAETRMLLQLPVRTDELLDQLARRSPAHESLLLREGRPLAVVYRGGRRLSSGDWIESGDEIDLVVAISGG